MNKSYWRLGASCAALTLSIVALNFGMQDKAEAQLFPVLASASADFNTQSAGNAPSVTLNKNWSMPGLASSSASFSGGVGGLPTSEIETPIQLPFKPGTPNYNCWGYGSQHKKARFKPDFRPPIGGTKKDFQATQLRRYDDAWEQSFGAAEHYSYGHPCYSANVNIVGGSLGDTHISHGGVHIGGAEVSVNVHNNVNVSGQSTHNFWNRSLSGGSGQFYGGGGGGYAPTAAPVGQSMTYFNSGPTYETQTITEQVPTTEEYCERAFKPIRQSQAIRAVCMDDNGHPHPAAQIDGGQAVPSGYSGELFRCLAGTHMQVTLGQYGHKASFRDAKSFSCRKGEALRIDGNGQVSCAAQIPRRECNERSLLRRHGPGIKVIHGIGQEEYCKPASRIVMKEVQKEIQVEKPGTSTAMVLDGGVGQGL